jgi:hypothetical protein
VRQTVLLFLFLSKQLYLSAQYNYPWEYVGPEQTREQIKGMFKALWIDETDPNHMMAGSACGGLFVTENAMDQIPEWKNITDSYVGMTFGVNDIVVKTASNRKEIYIASGHGSAISKAYGNGILKTTDGGKTWNRIGPTPEAGSNENMFPMNGLVANKENEAEMIAYTAHDVYVTRNYWQSFEKIELPLDKSNKDLSICDAEFAPFEPGKFYICTRTYNNVYDSRIFVCENYGWSIKDIFPEGVKSERAEVATIYDRKFKGKFYVALGWVNCYVQFFDGKKFSGNLNSSPITQTHAGAYWNFEFAVNQIDTNIMYLSMTETSRSSNGGKTFEKISYYNAPNTHADNRAMTLVKSTPRGKNDLLILGNDGGISMADQYEPPNWRNLNGKGLDANLFWGVSVAQSDTLLIAAGAQDNGGFILTEQSYWNNMANCGDGYLALALDEHAAIVECNAPSMYYHNISTGRTLYLPAPDNRYEGRRPLALRDSFVYVGFGNIWRIHPNQLLIGKAAFEKFNEIPIEKTANGQTKNHAIKCFAFGTLNSAVLCYGNPNWEEKNNGKLYFCSNLKKNKWIDITEKAVYNGFEVCRWSEITSVELDIASSNKFYFLCRDINDQSNTRLFQMQYFENSEDNHATLKELGLGLPKVGINQIKIDKFSNVMYLAADDGIYYSHLNGDTVIWQKFNSTLKPLPSTMVFGIDFNYHTNSIYAGTFARGIWRSTLLGLGQMKKVIKKNSTQTDVLKIDGKLSLRRNTTLHIQSKIILTKTSKIELKSRSNLIIADRNLVRNELNEIVAIEDYLIKHPKAHIKYK